jgi:protein-disulfide isomerase
MLQRRQFVFGTAVGLAGLSLGATLGARAQGSPTPQDVYFDPGNPVLGNPKGDVTIAEYFDFQCPYCKRDFPKVRKVVEEDGNVRLVMKDWPIFGEPSVYASHLSLAARTLGKGDVAIEALMATKGRLSQSAVDKTLEKAGLDVGALKAAYAKHRKSIEAVIARNGAQAQAFGFPGTPAYVIGRMLYPGVLGESGLKQAVAEARKKS